MFYRVAFPKTVKWMTLEFDPACSTAQPEDSLQLYVPTTNSTHDQRQLYTYPGTSDEAESPPLPYWPVLHKFSSWLVSNIEFVPEKNFAPFNTYFFPAHSGLKTR